MSRILLRQNSPSSFALQGTHMRTALFRLRIERPVATGPCCGRFCATMKIAVLLTGLFLLAFPLSISAATTNGPEQWQALFSARYAALQAAISKRNQPAIVAMLTPDFVYVDRHWQNRSAAEMIAEILPSRDDERKNSALSMQSINIANGHARIEQRTVTTIKRHSGDGQKHNITQIVTATDIWVQFYGNWLLRRREIHSFEEFVDGKRLIR